MGITPLVSINAVSFNHAKFLPDFFKGIFSQKTDFPFELLIHDDCSTDGSQKIIAEAATSHPNIVFPLYEVENQYSKGLPWGGAVWNLPRAKGKYYAYCEGDDYWCDSYKLQRQIKYLEDHPEVGMIYTRVRNFDCRTNNFTGEFGGTNTSFEDLFFNSTIPTATVVVRTDLARKYEEDVKPQGRGWAMGDYPRWLWFALNSKIAFQPEVTAVYRVLPESASHSRSLARRYQFRLRSNPVSEYFIERYAHRFTPEFVHRARSSRHEQTLPMALLMRDWPMVDKIREYYASAEAAGHATPASMCRMLAHPRLWRELIRMRNAASDIKNTLLSKL